MTMSAHQTRKINIKSQSTVYCLAVSLLCKHCPGMDIDEDTCNLETLSGGGVKRTHYFNYISPLRFQARRDLSMYPYRQTHTHTQTHSQERF